MESDLAHSPTAIAQGGPPAFYEGRIAQKIIAAVQRAGETMTTEDLERYCAVERMPVQGTYHDVVSVPPPSRGGVALIEMPNTLEGYYLAATVRHRDCI